MKRANESTQQPTSSGQQQNDMNKRPRYSQYG